MFTAKYYRCYLSCLSGFLSFMCFGMIISYPSPAFPDINKGSYGFKLSSDAISWLASFSGLFAIPGTMISPYIMDRYGRKFSIVFITAPMTIGWLIIVASSSVTGLAIGRAILGFTVGMVSSSVFIYISEISPKQIRGKASRFTAVSFSFGTCLVNLLGAFINWRWIAITCLAFVTATALSTHFMYETPRWLVSKGYRKAAAHVIRQLWKSDDPQIIETEITAIEENLRLVSSINYWDCLRKLVRPPFWKPLLFTQLLMTFQQLTGVAYTINYTVAIFQEATANFHTADGFLQNPNYQSCVMFIADIVGHFVSMAFIDRLGCRVLLLSAAVIFTISMSAVGAYYYVQLVNVALATQYLYWLPLIFLLIFHFGYAFAFNLTPYLLASEVFAVNVRGVANSLVALNHNVCFLLVVKGFPMLTAVVPSYGIFWIFASSTFVCIIFVYFCIPETKDRSIEEIQLQWFSSK